MSLEIEYKQWFFITNDLYKFIYKELALEDLHNQQEGRNVLQHWLLVANQDENIIKYQYYPLLPKIDFDEEKKINNKLVKLLVTAVEEKKFFWIRNHALSTVAVFNILKFIDDSHNLYNFENVNIVPLLENGIVKIEKFKCVKFVNLPHLLKNFNIIDVSRMILRYESLGNGSYQWGDPKELHMCYYNDYNVRYEGFASPFNSRFIGLPDCRFCSLFPDTDAVFGSLGNFFNVDLTKYPGAWSVNPPFINEVMERVSQKLIKALDSGVKSTFFCTYPYWKDSVGWKLLEDSKYLKESFHRKVNIVIQDAYGRVFTPSNGLSLFCISLYHLNLNNIADMLNKKVADFDRSFNRVLCESLSD